MALRDLNAALRLQDTEAWSDAGLTESSLAQAWWHAGFDPDEAAVWRLAGQAHFAAEPEPLRSDELAYLAVAQTFRTARFTVEEMRAWRVALRHEDGELILDLVHEARRWRAAGFDPAEVERWCHTGPGVSSQDLEGAVLYANAGWSAAEASLLEIFLRERRLERSIDELSSWLSMSRERAIGYAKAGVSLTHAQTLESVGLTQKAFDIEMRARYELLPELHPRTIRQIDQVLVALAITEVDRPFYAEPVEAAAEEGQGVLPPSSARGDGFCRGSGGPGELEFRDGMEDWYVTCPVCQVRWMGGSGAKLDDHKPYL